MEKTRITIKGGRELNLTTFDPHRLSPNNANVVVDRLTPLTAEGFMCSVSPALRQDVANHVLGCDELSYVRDGKEVVAFTAVSRRFK